MDIFLAMLLKPFFALLLLVIAWPFVWLVHQMPDNRLKRLLLTRISADAPGTTPRQ
jgi:hypothetical protein